MSNTTPGPWHLKDRGWGPFIKIEATEMFGGEGRRKGARNICVVTRCANSEMAQANARLIAAAPELLQWAKDSFAKQMCVCKLNPLVDGPVPCETCQLGALLVKATGGDE